MSNLLVSVLTPAAICFSRTLEVRSREIVEQLVAAGVGSRPVIWVGHSMGGLLIKQILVSARETSSLRHLVDNTHGVVFYSVPHEGSSLADFSSRTTAAYLLSPSVEVRDLRAGSILFFGWFMALARSVVSFSQR